MKRRVAIPELVLKVLGVVGSGQMRASRKMIAMVLCAAFVAALVAAGAVWTRQETQRSRTGNAEPNPHPAPVRATIRDDGTKADDLGTTERNAAGQTYLNDTGPMIDASLAEVSEAVLEEVSEKSDAVLRKAAARRIYEAQDETVGKWPRYSEVRARYYHELASVFDMNSVSEEQLVESARAFRSAFWSAGACSSAASYPDIYKSRILLECAHERFPEDLNVIDELVETIQSYNMVYHVDNEQGRYVYNGDYLEEMIRLRAKQFRLVQQQLQAGRAVTMQDFTCACDLAYIVQGKNKPAAKRVVTWLRNNAGDTWPQYNDLLSKWETYLDQGLFHQFPIYEESEKGEYDPIYQRRLPSFRGPASRSVVFWSKDKPPVFGARRDTMWFHD